ncbi:MAG: hypothetical protein K0U98_17165 [Deltaproteobacteria bacterium]|nr:hypothetical protein [Deltaproteobacteria bacterium]
MLVPQENSANERHIAFRFDSLGELEEFWSSSDSKEWRAQLDELVSQPSRYHQEIGIEHWFTMPDGAAPPSRHRMMVVVFLAILPLVTFIPARLTPWLATFMPAWLAGIVTTAVLVVLMTYLAVPLVGRLLRPWLNPARRVDLDSP